MVRWASLQRPFWLQEGARASKRGLGEARESLCHVHVRNGSGRDWDSGSGHGDKQVDFKDILGEFHWI